MDAIQDFGQALSWLKVGQKVAREGWNGKGMFILLQIPDANSKMTIPYIYMDSTNSNSNAKVVVPWLPSQSDILAEDWIKLD
jgi:hypothetical protein